MLPVLNVVKYVKYIDEYDACTDTAHDGVFE